MPGTVGKSGRKYGGGGDNRDGTSAESETGAVDGLNSLLVCGGFVLQILAVQCFEEDSCMLVDVCVIDVESSEAALVINDVVEVMKFEGF